MYDIDLPVHRFWKGQCCLTYYQVDVHFADAWFALEDNAVEALNILLIIKMIDFSY